MRLRASWRAPPPPARPAGAIRCRYVLPPSRNRGAGARRRSPGGRRAGPPPHRPPRAAAATPPRQGRRPPATSGCVAFSALPFGPAAVCVDRLEQRDHQRAFLFAQFRSPDVEQQYDPRAVAVVPRLVLDGVVEGPGPSLDPVAEFVA